MSEKDFRASVERISQIPTAEIVKVRVEHALEQAYDNALFVAQEILEQESGALPMECKETLLKGFRNIHPDAYIDEVIRSEPNEHITPELMLRKYILRDFSGLIQETMSSPLGEESKEALARVHFNINAISLIGNYKEPLGKIN